MPSSLRLAALLCAAALAAPAHAQEWPAKPVKIVVPFAAGGSSDQFARLLAAELSATFKQQFFIENRAGSRGALGSAQVARAEPDGYTFVNAGSGPHLTGPAINPNIGYDPLKDFTHVAMEAADSFVLVAGTALGVKIDCRPGRDRARQAADLGLAGAWLARPSHPRAASSAAPASTSSTCRRPIPA